MSASLSRDHNGGYSPTMSTAQAQCHRYQRLTRGQDGHPLGRRPLWESRPRVAQAPEQVVRFAVLAVGMDQPHDPGGQASPQQRVLPGRPVLGMAPGETADEIVRYRHRIAAEQVQSRAGKAALAAVDDGTDHPGLGPGGLQRRERRLESTVDGGFFVLASEHRVAG
jgi:hypothetical protein